MQTLNTETITSNSLFLKTPLGNCTCVLLVKLKIEVTIKPLFCIETFILLLTHNFIIALRNIYLSKLFIVPNDLGNTAVTTIKSS